MLKVQLDMIEEFQCPGCVCGNNTSDCRAFKPYDDMSAPFSFCCTAHVPGTTAFPGGKMCLGLPKGFNKTGNQRWEDYTPSFYVRLFDSPEKHPEWDVFNVPVWAKEENGYLFVRTFCPRTNRSFVDVIKGGTLAMVPNAINVTELDMD